MERMKTGIPKIHKLDKVQKAEERIRVNPWDIEAWSVLLRDAQSKRIDESRPQFERIVERFPLAGQYWKIYIQQEMKAKNYEKVEKLFQRCLIKILHIDLWKLYLQYIKETKGKQPGFKEKMAQAYDFALDKMGLDLNSYSIWSDYVQFLKSTNVVGSYAESQKITAIRRVYQRAIVTPMMGIETIWRDYCMYENSINPLIAKKFTEDRSREYMNARRVSKEFEVITKGLNRNMPSIPPMNSPEEVKQVELWKKYIQWEKDNPLKTEDITTITRRVMFAYEQSLLCMGHHPDIWYEAASYLEHASKLLAEKGDQATSRQFANEAAGMYERAIHVLKENMMLYFAYADYEEGRMKYEKVHSIYKKLISIESIDPTLPFVQYMKFARRAEGIKSARAVFRLAREDRRCTYQVFVAAALMEYFCSKDKTIGHKIFELGMRKFGDVPEYVLSYVDYMSHLNEDNNTRVLFERALSSGQIQIEKTRMIWAKFLEFESHVGDLPSILKVEKRRLAAFEEVKEYQGKETALLIDRYRFLDLFPCSETELRALGYTELARQQLVQLHSGSGHEVKFLTHSTDAEKPAYPKPDVNQMLPFKPKAYPRTNAHPVSGGEFPPPPAASNLLKVLPPPESYHGPFVQVDRFMEHFLSLDLPDDFLQQVQQEEVQIDSGTALSIQFAAQGYVATAGRKRRLASESGGPVAGGNDSDDDDFVMLSGLGSGSISAAINAPSTNLYQARMQQKRFRTG